MAKYKQRYLQPSGWSLKGHWMVGWEWEVYGTKGDKYLIEATDKGFTCPCYGFTFHGKCKHVKSVIDRIEGDAPEYKVAA